MRRRNLLRSPWVACGISLGVVFFTARLARTVFAAAAPPSPPPTITKVVLLRVPGGPSYHWDRDRVILQRPADGNPDAAAAFARLSRWLERDRFFSRKSGYVDPRSLFVTDAGYLVIKVVRGGHLTQVWSYNGARDEELSQTEAMVRQTASAMRRARAKTRRQQNRHRHNNLLPPTPCAPA